MSQSRVQQFKRNFELRETYLRLADPEEVRTVLARTESRRSHHRSDNNGYSRNKGRTMRDLGSIPRGVYFGPMFDGIHNPKMDAGEQADMMRGFFQAFPKFLNVDKQ
jgi:hypothetical protein